MRRCGVFWPKSWKGGSNFSSTWDSILYIMVPRMEVQRGKEREEAEEQYKKGSLLFASGLFESGSHSVAQACLDPTVQSSWASLTQRLPNARIIGMSHPPHLLTFIIIIQFPLCLDCSLTTVPSSVGQPTFDKSLQSIKCKPGKNWGKLDSRFIVFLKYLPRPANEWIHNTFLI